MVHALKGEMDMKIKYVFLGLMISILMGCGDSSTTTTTTGLNFTTTADFTASASESFSALKALTATCAEREDPTAEDDPTLADGVDCDGDDGIVAHLTPSQYSLAFKRVTLKSSEGADGDIDLIADTGTLAQSEVIDFTSADASESVITIEPGDLTAGTYAGIEAELYYFQLTFPVSGTTQTVRFYMSDDDFVSEGSLGHHQGDITFINADGTEAGWVDSTWLTENLATTRSTEQNGAGGEDEETGHFRGFFGNAAFWNAADQVQGNSQDIYLMTLDFDTPLEVPDPATITGLTTITATFSVADTFFFEDFSPYGTGDDANTSFLGFWPDEGGDAGGDAACLADDTCNSSWAPLTPSAVIAYD